MSEISYSSSETPEPPYCNAAGMKRIAELEAMVRELVMDLENEIDGRYPNKQSLEDQPILQRRYNRDIDVCRRARRLLEQ